MLVPHTDKKEKGVHLAQGWGKALALPSSWFSWSKVPPPHPGSPGRGGNWQYLPYRWRFWMNSRVLSFGINTGPPPQSIHQQQSSLSSKGLASVKHLKTLMFNLVLNRNKQTELNTWRLESVFCLLCLIKYQRLFPPRCEENLVVYPQISYCVKVDRWAIENNHQYFISTIQQNWSPLRLRSCLDPLHFHVPWAGEFFLCLCQSAGVK